MWNICASYVLLYTGSVLPSSSTSDTNMCLDASSAKKTPLTEEHFLSKLDQMRDHLKEANLRISDLLSKVDDLNLEGKDKDAKIRSLIKRNRDLERQLLSGGKMTGPF